MGLSSCDDNLDIKPKDKVDLEDYFKTASDCELFSTQFYAELLETKPYSYQDDHVAKQSLSNELLCGDARSVPGTGGGWKWTELRRINTMLEYIPKNCTDPEAAVKYTAVGKFFRAYFYFEKIKRFGDVPWIDKQLFSTDDQLYAPRDSRELVLSNMIKDIDDAINDLPIGDPKDPYHVSQAAALALKSRFCLFEGTYRKYHGINLDGHGWEYYLNQCVDASEKLMSGKYGKFDLYTTNKPEQDYRDLFTQIDATSTKGEYILAVNYGDGVGIFHDANNYLTSEVKARPSAMLKLVASYLMKDGSRFTDKPGWDKMSFADQMKDRDPRLAQTIRATGHKRYGESNVSCGNFNVSSTGFQPIKYVTAQKINNNDCDMANRSLTDMPVYRYAEVLLNYAEAKAVLGTLTDEDLNKSVNLIRKRAGMPAMKTGNSADWFLTDPNYGYFNETDGDILEIRREREIELVQEHHRYWDLMRWKEGKCIDQPMYGLYIPGPCEIDMSGDGKTDVVFYAEGSAKPQVASGVVAIEIGKQIKLSNGTSGFSCNHHTQDRSPFNENRDYLYPIPSQELNLNPSLVQNPGWKK